MDLKELLLDDNNLEESFDCILEMVPELRLITGFDNYKRANKQSEIIKAIKLSKKDFDVRLSLLLYKLGDYEYLDKEEITRNILSRLGYEEKNIKKIIYLINNYNKPITKKQTLEDIDLSFKLYEIQRCDKLSKEKENIKVLYNPRNISC